MNPTCGTMYSQWTAIEYLLMFAIKIINILLTAKHAPMCTFGVGGNPLLIGLGGVCLFRSLLLGGIGGVSDSKSGLILSLSRSADISLSPEKDNI
ncbi:hypothetical protein ALC62_07328 [Cyphomyrmex costatus]|uniref:Uncharacterized protein n=1 Tax=Cyphomyrmex costatus TaxID=456900 RepID=A0A195CM97_9HYME|nr:hypothetical protein ALC62_07328 [Cyphomyrmex costatus]